MSSFERLGLRAELVQAVIELGYENPTPIQEGAIPALLEGRDVLGQAQTGTGKTAAFSLPMLERIDFDLRQPQGLILAPTRELAVQVAEAVIQYGRKMGIRVAAIYGGSSYFKQLKRLEEGVHVVVGTPGRVIDLIERGALVLGGVRYLVLDEADEMLKMGFIDDVERILRETPETRQTALFSATLPSEIRALSNKYLHDPVSVTIAQKTLTVPLIAQKYFLIDEEYKLPLVGRLLETEEIKSALVFTRTKIGAANLADALLARGFPVEAIHGDLSQDVRETVMRRFRSGLVHILVATDVAARGIDIESVSHVINFDIPYDAEDYVHRIGRTGRAGREGSAITLVTPRERRLLRVIEHYTKGTIARAPIPTAEEVLAKRDAAFSATLSDTIAAPDLTREIGLIASMIESGYDVTEVAAAAVRLARRDDLRRPLDEVREPAFRERREGERPNGVRDRYGRSSGGNGRYERGDRPARSYSPEGEDRPRRPRTDKTGREAGMVRLMVDAGRDHGVQPGDVVGAIAGRAGIPGKAIGAIDIHRSETYVDVMEAHVDRVLRQMKQGATLRGKEVTIRRVDSN
ncbi:MAG: DEAD/DEAH box helicase [bacterium]|nr:DEAD/DEAH box helicase [bacterium]